jgi:hypothetical protein
MGYLRLVHRCNKPETGNWGDVWQCDSCQVVLVKTLIGWGPFTGEIKGVVYDAGAISPKEESKEKPDRPSVSVEATIRGLLGDGFTSYLAEGTHTAWRKATDWDRASEVWNLIQAMPSDEWGDLNRWLGDTLVDYVVDHLRDHLEVRNR